MSENDITERPLAPLFLKMARVMGKMNRLEKRGHNDHFNYDFVTSEDVLDLVRQAMAEEKLAFFVNIIETQRGEKMTKAHLLFIFADGETGATFTCNWESEAVDTQDKGISKAVTSGVKYFLLKTFLISTGDEPDPDASEKTASRKSQSATVHAPAAQAEATNGHDERPYLASIVKKGIENRAKKHKDFKPTTAQQQLLRYGLELCFPGDPNAEDKRHTLLKYLTGEASTKNINGSTFKAIVEDWLKMTQDSGGAYSIDGIAAQEAEGVVTAALVGEGQQALFEEPK